MTFDYSQQNIDELKRVISSPRFSRYLQLVGNNSEEDALMLYVLNARLSGSFIHLLQIVEVALRNSLDQTLITAHGSDWLTGGAVSLGPRQIQQVKEARRRACLPAGVCIDDLSFGFWVELLTRYYEQSLWIPCLHGTFQIRAALSKRKEVHNLFDDIRRFRNRVAHHDQVVSREPKMIIEKIITALGWLSPTMSQWVAGNEEATSAWDDILIIKATRGWTGF